MHKAHDSLFRRTFEDPANAAALLRTQLSPALVRRLDWSTLAPDHGTLVDGDLSRRRTDLLFTIRFRRKRELLYVLQEHWSRPERFAMLRLLGYKARIWERCLARNPGRPLPTVMAVILFHGPRRWNSPTTLLLLTNLADLPPQVQAELRLHVPDFQVLLDDLATRPGLGRDLPARPQLTLHCMQEVPRKRGAQVLRAVLRAGHLVRQVLRQRGGNDFLDTLWLYVGDTSRTPVDKLRLWVARHFGKLGEESIMNTWAQVRAKSRAEGKAEGKAEGRVEESAEQLLRQLRKRFGGLPVIVEGRVRRAAIEQLHRWHDRLFAAKTMAEVFGRTRLLPSPRTANGRR